MKTKLLVLVLALQTAWVVGTALTHENILRTGRLVLLETQPVDPRDLLRGDYIRLNYQISDVPRDRISPPWTGEVVPGTAVYVALEPGKDGFFQLSRASRESFEPVGDEVVLRGTAGESWRNGTGSIHVEYGLEQYFVPEGGGNPHGKLTVQVAVAKSGQASIKQVFVDGQPFTKAMQ